MSMQTIIPLSGLGIPVPVPDEAGKPVIVEREFGGAKVKVPLSETQMFPANKAIKIDAKVAKELIAKKRARAFDAELDFSAEDDV